MDFAVPGFLGDLSQFEATYQDNMGDASRLEEVVTPLILRRKIADVATDLPSRIDVPQVLQMSSAEAEAYEALRRAVLANVGPGAQLASLTKLRMLSAHPFLVEGLGGSGDPALFSTKYQRLLELLDEVISVNEKALIFTSYQRMCDILQTDLAARLGIPCMMIDGRVPVSSRQPLLDQFQNHAGSAVLILNPRAGGVGLNITAANHVVHYNLEWNPAVEDQATARAHRRGQRRPVTVHRLFYANTVEEYIDSRMKTKREVAESAVVGTTGDFASAEEISRALALSPISSGDST
jgi:SNF2 family DNA or RNA helicase